MPSTPRASPKKAAPTPLPAPPPSEPEPTPVPAAEPATTEKPADPTPVAEPVPVAAAEGDAPAVPGPAPPAEPEKTAQEEAEEEEERQKIYDMFAEEHHDIVVELPLEYRRSFTLLTELEEAQQNHTKTLHSTLLSYISTLANPAPAAPTTATTDAAAPSPASYVDDEEGTMSNATRELLRKIAESVRGAVRNGEEKVGLASALYESVDRQIIHLDTLLARSEDSLLIGLRAGTLPSHDAPSTAPKSPPGRTTSWGARAIEIGEEEERGKNRKRSRKKKTTAAPAVEGAAPSSEGMVVEAVDPNEPTYCLCERVSFGEMVACDNDDCPREWFHLGCVDLTEPPDGSWYCPECRETLNIKDTKGKGKEVEGGKKKRRRSGW